jgi:WD40 repeat protein
MLAGTGGDRTIRVWETGRPQAQPLEFRGKDVNILALAIDDNGRVAVADDGGEVRIWDESKPGERPAENQEGSVNALAFLSDGRLVVGGSSGEVREVGKKGVVLTRHDGPVYALAVARDGRLASGGGKSEADGGRDWDVRVLDPSRPDSPPVIFSGHDRPVRALAFAADGRLAAGGSDGDVIVWDDRGRMVLPRPLNHSRRPIVALAFAAEQRLAAADLDGAGWVWDLPATGPRKSESPLGEKYQGSIAALEAMGQGRLAAAGAPGVTLVPPPAFRSQTVDLATRLLGSGADEREESIDLPAAGACRLAVSPNGRLLAAGLANGRVVVWTVPFDGPGGLKDEARKVVGRNLTRKEWGRYFPSEPYHKTFPELPDGEAIDDR